MISGRYFLVKRSVCASPDSRRVTDVSCGHFADDSGLILVSCGDTNKHISQIWKWATSSGRTVNVFASVLFTVNSSIYIYICICILYTLYVYIYIYVYPYLCMRSQSYAGC